MMRPDVCFMNEHKVCMACGFRCGHRFAVLSDPEEEMRRRDPELCKESFKEA